MHNDAGSSNVLMHCAHEHLRRSFAVGFFSKRIVLNRSISVTSIHSPLGALCGGAAAAATTVGVTIRKISRIICSPGINTVRELSQIGHRLHERLMKVWKPRWCAQVTQPVESELHLLDAWDTGRKGRQAYLPVVNASGEVVRRTRSVKNSAAPLTYLLSQALEDVLEEKIT
ncbi:hypothetical protein DL93DRAFT_2160128 [Clavulina sp. PMI_390]|nr:hypothetical protein DL93DRAFT_2160128 [Clavulina sp. PMI_390]